MQNYVLKVKVVSSFSAESAEFLSCKAGELITLIAKDCHRYSLSVSLHFRCCQIGSQSLLLSYCCVV